jgi:hypothetical protein
MTSHPLAVPPCPSCQAGPPEVIWTGGGVQGGDSWRCSGCSYTWTTPGRPVQAAPGAEIFRASEDSGDRLTEVIAEARRQLARPDDEGLGCWSSPPRCTALEDALAKVCDLAEAVLGEESEPA